MSACNLTITKGRLGKDPELKYTGSGKPVVTFSVAVKVGRGKYEKTVWFQCSAFGDLALEIEATKQKGSEISVQRAQPDPAEWTDQRTGEKKSIMRWIIWNMGDPKKDPERFQENPDEVY